MDTLITKMERDLEKIQILNLLMLMGLLTIILIVKVIYHLKVHT